MNFPQNTHIYIYITIVYKVYLFDRIIIRVFYAKLEVVEESI